VTTLARKRMGNVSEKKLKIITLKMESCCNWGEEMPLQALHHKL